MEDGDIGLQWADYLVMAFSMVVALGIGVFFAFFRGGQKTKEAYLVGERRMGVVPVCVSMFVTFQSAVTLIGTPADTYNTGTMVLFLFPGISLAYLVGSVTMLPLFHPLRLTTIYHYLRLRFPSHSIRLLLTVLGLLQTSMFMGIVLYAPALVLQAVVGLQLWMSVVLVGVVGTIYTAIGGYKSVVWTDVFQCVIIFTGMTAAILKGLRQVGGMSRMLDIAADGGRLIFDDINPEHRHSYWSLVVGGCVFWCCHLFSQSYVQRLGSLPSLSHARWSLLLNSPLHLLYGLGLCLTGVLLYAYFVTIGCDPYAAGYVSNKNQVTPYFMLHVLRDVPGMPGLYMAMLFSGTLSSVSSGINGLATVTVEELLARPLRSASDTAVTTLAKGLVVVYGCVSLGLAYLINNLSGPVSQIAFAMMGAFAGPTAGVFVTAAAFPRCNTYGAGAGLGVGAGLTLGLAVGSSLYGAPTPSLPPGPLHRCHPSNGSWTPAVGATWNGTDGVATTVGPRGDTSTSPDSLGHRGFTVWDISYMWLSPIGLTATILTAVLVSLLTGCRKESDSVDPKLIFPFCRKLYGLPDLPLSDQDSTVIPCGTDPSPRTDQMETALWLPPDRAQHSALPL